MVELLTGDAIKACVACGKTSYQLDLEVKDRNPGIVPKVGDKVKIKSREWYEKWKDKYGDVVELGTRIFASEMSKYCGKVFKVKSVTDPWFTLEDARFDWIMPMIEEVYPQESSKAVKCAKAFESLGINGLALEKQLIASSAIPAINPVQGIGIATDWSKLASDTSAIITLPGNRGRVAFTQAETERLRDRWSPKEEPELQTIKKHRFIKLEKL